MDIQEILAGPCKDSEEVAAFYLQDVSMNGTKVGSFIISPETINDIDKMLVDRGLDAQAVISITVDKSTCITVWFRY